MREQRFQARRRGEIDILTFDQWLEICERQQQLCAICGVTPPQLCIDHIVPSSSGGLTHRVNIQGLCHSCNSRKGMRVPTLEEARQ